MKRVLWCAALIVWSGLASATVYKWMDVQGKLHYGDRPPVGVHAEVVEMPGSHAPRASTATDASSTPKPPNPASPAPASDADLRAKQAVDADVTQSKEKECAEAQDLYKKLIEGRRLYKTGADGERQYLSSAEIDQARVNAKLSVDTACNSPT